MKKKKSLSILKYFFMIIVSFISIFPFLWMIISATNDAREITAVKLTFGTHLVENLRNLFHSDLNFGASLGYSTFIAVITTVLALLISSVAGYGFEIFRSKARDRVFNILLLSMMVPFCALMIPLYRMFGAVGKTGLTGIGLNTLISVIAPYVCTAFLIFFFRQNTKSFPKDILEAARIDGLNETRIFFHMYMPVMKSSYAAGAIITFMSSWNNYLWPLVALQDPQKRTVPLILSAMGSSYTPDYGMIMAGIVIATLPTGFLFFMMQKQFVAGMIGSVK
ncbi:Lactose transport system permease protein LacG [Caprobacter fermentans]|uniref:Lactose transport system permease protein LacG n=1 Tax=Caproicibacter fermentans TaxID=2576756 RepID=A0A6N8HYC4_9FIRM|nr:carbohydrate ABC transporter permease [Caproicibacter fermentans]MVB10854.1 Lactose transport system permease protein LacG [Caproicibacter fermentans]